MTTITVRPGSLTPGVTFTCRFYGEKHEGQVKDVLETWTRITGMNFERMPREWKLHEEDGQTYIWVRVAHPLDNRSDVNMFWLVEKD